MGGNLLSKYSMLGRFYTAHEGLEFLEDVIRGELPQGTYDPEQLRTVFEFLHQVILHTPFKETMEREVAFETPWDIQRWASEGYRAPLSDYRFDASRRYRGFVKPETKRLIASKVDTFGEHPAGLGKFTRTLFARDLRRTFE